MRVAPYLVAILVLIAFQTAFGIYVRATTGSHLSPVIFDSVKVAVVIWFVFPCVMAVIDGLDRESPWASYVSNLRSNVPGYGFALLAQILFSLSLAMMNWTKSMIPAFTADFMLADLDHALFGTDPALLFRIPVLENVFAIAYFVWMPLVFGSASLVAYLQNFRAVLSLILVTTIDTIAQYALPSAGPIFWQRLGFGDRFDYLVDSPGNYQLVSNFLWGHYQSGTLMVGTGISAFPSMHVALSAWMVLTFPRARIIFFPFLLLVFAGSLASGWHYLSDGLAGCVMAYVAHRLVNMRKVDRLTPQIALS